MSDKKRLVASFIQFLIDEHECDNLASDAKESLEVAMQCLESAYDINPVDESLLSSQKLLDIFNNAVKGEFPKQSAKPVSEEAKSEAERLKNEGNNLMKNEQFRDALISYTKAIEIDGSNAVYYCNRAAAHSKLNDHTLALEDCKRAINCDPNYSKAYGRMGLAYASMNDHHRARDCYRKAVDLEPNNEGYQNNLRIAEEKMAEQSSNPFASMGMGAGMGMGGMPFDMTSLFSNPALMNMATQLMSNPAMQNLMGGLMSNAFGGGGGPSNVPDGQGAGDTAPEPGAGVGAGIGAGAGAGAGVGAGTPPGIETLLQAGQQIAAQMQASNPELIEQLRNVMGQRPNPGGDPSDQQPQGDGNNGQRNN